MDIGIIRVWGDRDNWFEFVDIIRKRKRKNPSITIWKVLKPCIDNYIKKYSEENEEE